MQNTPPTHHPSSQSPHEPAPGSEHLHLSDHRVPRLSALLGLFVWICGLISIDTEIHSTEFLKDTSALTIIAVGVVSLGAWFLLKTLRRHWTITRFLDRPPIFKYQQGFSRQAHEITLPHACTLVRRGRKLVFMDANTQAPAATLRFATQRSAILTENKLLEFLDPHRVTPMRETPSILDRARLAPATFFLIALNVMISSNAWLRGESFLMSGALSNASMHNGEYYRLLTSMFLHYNGLHLMMNMLALMSLGTQVERIVGSKRMLFIYMLAGLGGGFWALRWIGSVQLMGASGAVFGLFGSVAYFIYLGRNQLPPTVYLPTGRQLSTDLLINAGLSLLPMISFSAHFGGFVSGFLLSGLVMMLWPIRRPSSV